MGALVLLFRRLVPSESNSDMFFVLTKLKENNQTQVKDVR
jgi:hypothetical protein